MADQSRSNYLNHDLPISLKNPKGQNNCFLNSVIQVLMHLNAFRKDFKYVKELYCLGNSCIYCAFKKIFTQSEFKEYIQPDVLRNSMASAFSDQDRFQLKSMEDAAECYEVILDQLHHNLSKDTRDKNDCSYFSCLVHRKFASFIHQQIVANCNCVDDYEMKKLNQFVNNVTTNNLRCAYDELKRNNDFDICQMFGTLLQLAFGYFFQEECKICGEPLEYISHLMNIPSVITIGIHWNTDREPVNNIRKTCMLIQPTLLITQLFNEMEINIAKEDDRYDLEGIICYYRLHYISFIYKKLIDTWFKCDDATVINVGKFKDTIISIVDNKYQPKLLIYASKFNMPLTPDAPPTS